MTDVLLVASKRPGTGVLVDAVRRFHDQGARVYLAGFFDVARLADESGVDGFRSLVESGRHYGDTFARAARTPAEPSREVWAYAERDPWIHSRARRAAVLVALDSVAVYTVWELARLNEHAEARFGLEPALKALEGLTGEASARRLLPRPHELARRGRRRAGLALRTLPRVALSGPVLRTKIGARAWRAAVAASPVSDETRANLASTLSRRMHQAQRPRAAGLVVDEAASRIRSLRARADLRIAAAEPYLSAGRVPDDLPGAVQAVLDCADDEYADGDVEAALGRYVAATNLAFDRAVHFDGMRSPLAEDPAGFIAPFARSAVAGAAGAPKGRLQPAAPVTGRAQRVVVATRGNANFLGEILTHLGEREDVEVKFVDLARMTPLSRYATDTEALARARLGAPSLLPELLEEHLRAHLDWADTVFVDWALSAAIFFTLIDPGQTRVVLRLHSFEAFRHWPQLIDYSRVDEMIFVSEHLRDLAQASIPALSAAETRTHVVPNAMDLRRFARPKRDGARFNLAVVGVGHLAKDPGWALEVIRLLREEDPRYRLFHVGAELKTGTRATERAYVKQVRKRLASMTDEGAVVRVGQTDDVPGVLQDVGVMLSTSVRESFHCALVEGAASGAVPVVRDWPFFAGKANGARTLFPPDWVVGTPEEAVARILSVTADEEAWRAAGQAASQHAIARWDWDVVREQFDGPLLGLGPQTGSGPADVDAG